MTGASKSVPRHVCVNCGKPGPHFAPPSSGHPGGFTCAPATPEATEREDEYGRLLVALHTRLCGECPAFPGCGEACDPRTCDCCHDDGDPLEMLDAYAAAVRRAERERIARLVAETFNAIPRYRMVKQLAPRGKPPVIEFTYHDPKRHKSLPRAMDAAQVMDSFAALLDRLREEG